MRTLARVGVFELSYENNTGTSEYFLKKYEPYAVKVNFDMPTIVMYTDQPQYSKLKEELEMHKDKIRVSEWLELEYSKEELDSAEFLLLYTRFECDEGYADSPELFYDIWGEGKGRVAVHQHSDLMIRKKDMKNRDLFASWEGEYCVSSKLKGIFENELVDGSRFRPVYTMKDKENPIAYQIETTNILPKIHSKSNIVLIKEMHEYNFKVYGMYVEYPAYYSKDIIKAGCDFNRTLEYYGPGWFPRPQIVISQRVRKILEKSKVKGVKYKPIFIVDEE